MKWIFDSRVPLHVRIAHMKYHRHMPQITSDNELNSSFLLKMWITLDFWGQWVFLFQSSRNNNQLWTVMQQKQKKRLKILLKIWIVLIILFIIKGNHYTSILTISDFHCINYSIFWWIFCKSVRPLFIASKVETRFCAEIHQETWLHNLFICSIAQILWNCVYFFIWIFCGFCIMCDFIFHISKGLFIEQEEIWECCFPFEFCCPLCFPFHIDHGPIENRSVRNLMNRFLLTSMQNQKLGYEME